jgi:hypothetical protein
MLAPTRELVATHINEIVRLRGHSGTGRFVRRATR